MKIPYNNYYSNCDSDVYVELLRMLDYETDMTACVAIVRLSYGAMVSEPLTLQINLQDVNEPPLWTSNNGDYVFKLSEHNVRVPKYQSKYLT